MTGDADGSAEDSGARARGDASPRRPERLRALVLDRVARLRDVPRIYFGFTAAYVLIRFVAISGSPVAGAFPDSESFRQAVGALTYRFVSLTGRALRPWVVPVFYAAFRSDALRADAQVVVSIVSWLVLAAVVAIALRDNRVRAIAFVVVLALSCTTPVLNWDRVILSESLSISAGVLALAAWLRFVRRPTPWNTAAVILATTIWSFTRWALFPVVAVAAVLVAVTAVRRHERLLRAAVAIALIVVAAWGYGANARGDKEYKAFRAVGLSQFSTNFGYQLRYNILNDQRELSWFIGHGMPRPGRGLTPYVRSSPSDDDYGGVPAFLDAYRADTALASWVEAKGRAVYARYVVTHLDRFASRFVRELPYTIAPPRNQIVYASGTRGVLPNSVESLLFSTQSNDIPVPAGLGDVGLLLAACVAIVFFPKRRAVDRSLVALGLAGALLSMLGLAVAWVAAPVEIARHAIPMSVLLRVSLWIIVFAQMDAVVRHRRRAVSYS